LEEIPDDLVVKWDQTGIHYVPVSDCMMVKVGAKRVKIVGANDKRQITAVFAGTMSGEFLPPHLIYQGKTPKCLPPLDNVPSNWDMTFSENHWANNEVSRKNPFPLLYAKRAELQLSANYLSLIGFEVNALPGLLLC